MTVGQVDYREDVAVGRREGVGGWWFCRSKARSLAAPTTLCGALYTICVAVRCCSELWGMEEGTRWESEGDTTPHHAILALWAWWLLDHWAPSLNDLGHVPQPHLTRSFLLLIRAYLQIESDGPSSSRLSSISYSGLTMCRGLDPCLVLEQVTVLVTPCPARSGTRGQRARDRKKNARVVVGKSRMRKVRLSPVVTRGRKRKLVSWSVIFLLEQETKMADSWLDSESRCLKCILYKMDQFHFQT